MALDRILSRLLAVVALEKRASSGDDPNASSAKRLGAQDRMIPIMPKREQSDNTDRAKNPDFRKFFSTFSQRRKNAANWAKLGKMGKAEQ